MGACLIDVARTHSPPERKLEPHVARDEAEPRVEAVRVDTPAIARELHAMAATTPRLVDRVTHHRFPDPLPTDVGRDVDRFDLRHTPSAMREVSKDEELIRADHTLPERRDVEGAPGIGGDVVEGVEVGLEGAVARGLGMRRKLVVREQTEDVRDVVAGREADDERRDDGSQPPRAIFRAYVYAVTAARTWQIHPSVPPEPIHRPGVTISQKMPRRNLPL